MGQQIHPYGLRLGIITDWKSRWYSDKDYAPQVIEDAAIRKALIDELQRGAVSRIEIERIGEKKVQIDIHTARPGVVIGRSGSEVERLRTMLEKMTDRLIKINVIEIQDPETDAQLLARGIADQLQGRVSFRRAMKRAVQTAMKAGAQGVRVQCSGRLGGADMGRREWYREGRVPLHTLRADVDFGTATARTTVGAIGVKVWVYKGDVIPSLSSTRAKIAADAGKLCMMSQPSANRLWKCDCGTPARQSSIAGSTQSASGNSPYRSCAVSRASQIPGTETDRMPSVTMPSAKRSGVAAKGAAPVPFATSTVPLSFICTMMKPSEAMPDPCGSATPSAKPIATAASTALPPFSSIRMPAIDERGWLVTTAPCAPMRTLSLIHI